MSADNPATIDEVIAKLDAIVSEETSAGSQIALFAALYRLMTLGVKHGIADGVFDDAKRMERIDVLFAQRYFDALGAYRTDGAVPTCWQLAFDASSSSKQTLLQHLLLGINAHINHDLAIATADAVGSDLAAAKDDFYRINAVIEELLDKVQAALGEFSPLLRFADGLAGRADERLGVFVAARARDYAWRNAQLFAALPEERYSALEQQTDDLSASLARRIIQPGGLVSFLLWFVRATESTNLGEVVEAISRLDVR